MATSYTLGFYPKFRQFSEGLSDLNCKNICTAVNKYFHVLEEDFNQTEFTDEFIGSPDFLSSIESFCDLMGTGEYTAQTAKNYAQRIGLLFKWIVTKKDNNQITNNLYSAIEKLKRSGSMFNLLSKNTSKEKTGSDDYKKRKSIHGETDDHLIYEKIVENPFKTKQLERLESLKETIEKLNSIIENQNVLAENQNLKIQSLERKLEQITKTLPTQPKKTNNANTPIIPITPIRSNQSNNTNNGLNVNNSVNSHIIDLSETSNPSTTSSTNTSTSKTQQTGYCNLYQYIPQNRNNFK